MPSEKGTYDASSSNIILTFQIHDNAFHLQMDHQFNKTSELPQASEGGLIPWIQQVPPSTIKEKSDGASQKAGQTIQKGLLNTQMKNSWHNDNARLSMKKALSPSVPVQIEKCKSVPIDSKYMHNTFTAIRHYKTAIQSG